MKSGAKGVMVACSHCGRQFKPTREQLERIADGKPACCSNPCRLACARDQKLKNADKAPDLVCAQCGIKFAGSAWQHKQNGRGFPVYHHRACAASARAKTGRKRSDFMVQDNVLVRCPWETGAIKRDVNHCPL
jgi:hypothetical protein